MLRRLLPQGSLVGRKTVDLPLGRALVRAGLLHGYYIRRGGLTQDASTAVRFVFGKWSGARDLNPGPHGPEPWRGRVRPREYEIGHASVLA